MKLSRLARSAWLLAGLLASAAVLAKTQQEVETELLHTAQLWDAKNRPDIARQFIDKLLAMRSDSPDGLVLLADLALRENKPAQAAKILATLRQRHPGHHATRDLEILLRVYGPDKEKLAHLRLLARTSSKADTAELTRVRGAQAAQLAKQRKAQAAQLAHELFPSGPPAVGTLALEYCQIMAASAADVGEAAQQLTRLYRETGDARYRLAQLELQLDRSADPSAVLREIQTLEPAAAQLPGLQSLWRSALEKLANSPANAVWIQAFLRRFPGDRLMIERLAALQQASERAQRLARDPINMARNAARVALEANQLDLAQTQLEVVLGARPKDPESLGNLGLVRLRQGRHDEALELFTRANQLAPQAKWKDLQNTARFWGLLRQADLALERHALQAATGFALQARELQADNLEALLTLAGIKWVSGDAEAAQDLYQQVLRREPNHSSALRALAGLYSQQGRREQALALLEQAVANDPALATALADSRADLLSEQAQALIEAQRLSPALQTLEAALLLKPQDAWLRYRLARLYLRLDLNDAARQVMDEGVALFGQDAELRHARALIRSTLADDAGALADINQIARPQRSASVLALQQQAEVRLRIAQAEQTRSVAQADALLDLAEQSAGNDPDLLFSVANAWFKRGADARAVAVFDRLRARQPELANGAALRDALVQNRAKNDTALTQRLPALLSVVGWSETQELQLLALYTDHQERLIEQQRLAGHGAQASRLAQAPLPPIATSQQVERYQAQARLWLAAGAYAQAAELLELALQQRADDPDLHLDLGDALARQGLLHAAVQQAQWLEQHLQPDDLGRRLALLRLWQRSQSMAAAEQLAQRLLQRFPQQSEVLQHCARLARAQGRFEQALALLRRARALEPGNSADAANQVGTHPGAEVQEDAPPAALKLTQALSAPPRQSALATQAVDGPALKLILSLLPERLPHQSAPAAPKVSQTQLDIDAIEARRQSWFEFGQNRLQKSAASGISSLSGWERPLVLWWPKGYAGRYFLHADQVQLDAGALPASNAGDIGFGQIAPQPAALYPPGSAAQSASAVNLAVGYEGDPLRWDLGTVGVGFPVSNLVGGISQRLSMGRYNYTLELSRRPLTGSLLSYAGARDPVTGEVWGGVVATDVGAQVTTDLGPYSLSASAHDALLTGRNVASNHRLQTRFAVERDLSARPGQRLNLGLALSAWHYASDLSQFTWGQGGYYSPQHYLSLALPIEWSGRQGPLSWELRSSIGVSSSASTESDFFPGNAALQARIAQATSAHYAASASSGTSFSLRGALEYQLTPKTALGALLELDRSAYYAPNRLLLYLRYLFDPVLAPLDNRPRPVQSYSSF